MQRWIDARDDSTGTSASVAPRAMNLTTKCMVRVSATCDAAVMTRSAAVSHFAVHLNAIDGRWMRQTYTHPHATSTSCITFDEILPEIFLL